MTGVIRAIGAAGGVREKLARILTLAGLILTGASAGCLSQKNAPVPVRHFEPSSPRASTAAIHDVAVDERALRMTLGRVVGPTHLEEAMSWRLSEIEVAFDDHHHWVAVPPRLVDDALESALFVQGPFREVEDRDAARLDVQLVAFEGVRVAPMRARVAVVAALRPPPTIDGGSAKLTRRFEAEETLAASTPEALAEGMGAALASLLAELVAWLLDATPPSH